MKKEQRGITLIALIITIVVLLILAAVAISSITNDGILSYAENAAKDYNQAVKNEQEMLKGYEEYFDAYYACNWDEGQITTPATCTTVGVKTFTCTKHGETKTEEIPAIGHTVTGANIRGVWVEGGECGYIGTCDTCGAENANDKGGPHIFSGGYCIRACNSACDESEIEWEITTPATCTTPGYRNGICKKCINGSHTITDDMIPPLSTEYEHTYTTTSYYYMNESYHQIYHHCGVCGYDQEDAGEHVIENGQCVLCKREL